MDINKTGPIPGKPETPKIPQKKKDSRISSSKDTTTSRVPKVFPPSKGDGKKPHGKNLFGRHVAND